MENYATEGSKNLWMENEEYKWRLDADGEPTDEPVDKNNHAKDGVRYGVVTHKQLKRKKNIKVSKPEAEENQNPLDWI